MPLLSHCVFKPLYDKLQEASEKLFGYIEKYVNEHEEKLDLNTDPNDFIEAYLQEKIKKEHLEEGENYSKIQLLNVCRNLFEAGQETTADTILWSIIHLMLQPKIQQKLQKELENVVGKNNLVTLQDKPLLPYTQAIINESQRIANLLPISVRHTTTQDVTINGYKLKKGTIIVPHLSMVLYNEKIFPDPEKFDPDRFVSSNGQFKSCDEFIPFSIGKRQCLGESLAKMALFLIIPNLFNHFELRTVSDNPPSTERTMASGVSPKNFNANVMLR